MVMDSEQFRVAGVFRRSIQFQARFCLFPRDERLVAVFGNIEVHFLTSVFDQRTFLV
jgi:hypothetical protein